MQAALAQQFGCKGLLIYSDPSECAPGTIPTYPGGPSLPQFGIQRGSLLKTPGDPATPSLPSIGENFLLLFSWLLLNKSLKRKNKGTWLWFLISYFCIT